MKRVYCFILVINYLFLGQIVFGQISTDKAFRLNESKKLEGYLDNFDSQIPDLTPKETEWYENEEARHLKQVMKAASTGNLNSVKQSDAPEYAQGELKKWFKETKKIFIEIEKSQNLHQELRAWIDLGVRLMSADILTDDLARLRKAGVCKIQVGEFNDDESLATALKFTGKYYVFERIVDPILLVLIKQSKINSK